MSKPRRQSTIATKDLPALMQLRDSVTAGMRQRIKPTPPARYFIGHDQSGHTYVVPLARHAEWRKWSSWPEGDVRGWTQPEWATRIDGVSSISFTDWAEGV